MNKVVNIISALLQLSLLILWTLFPASQTQASLFSTALNLSAAILVVPLSLLEHNRSIRPSSVLSIYFLFSATLDLAQARTLYIRDERAAITWNFIAILLLKLVTLMAEGRSKKYFLRFEYQLLSPEATSGIINHSFLWWLNDLFRQGTKAILTPEDLYELDPILASEEVGRKLREAWAQRCKYWIIFSYADCEYLTLHSSTRRTIFNYLCGMESIPRTVCLLRISSALSHRTYFYTAIPYHECSEFIGETRE